MNLQIFRNPQNLSFHERGFWFKVVDRPGDASEFLGWVSLFAVGCLPSLLTLAIVGAFPRNGPANQRETCCRQCGYILRGISEPRCPECAERI
jgi:hypothetical protein